MENCVSFESNLGKSIEKIKGIGLDIFTQGTYSSLIYDGSKGNNFQDKNIRNLKVDNSRFINCNFSKAAGTGSKFIKCDFFGARFIASDMEFADFSNSKFLPFNNDLEIASTNNSSVCANPSSSVSTIFIGAGFNSCIMRETLFDNTQIEGSSFAMSDFSNSTIRDSNFIHSTMVYP